MLEELKIDILIPQEWAGWQGEEESNRKRVQGYTNFMLFKKKAEEKTKKPSLLAMKRAERVEYMKKSKKGRKKGTTILVRNELLKMCNVREIERVKDGEIEVIELTKGKQKIVIMGIHGEPESEKEKKESFFKKIENIIEHNIKGEGRILIGGDANSVWEDKDTNNEEKKDLDKTIKEFCKKRNWTDLSRK